MIGYGTTLEYETTVGGGTYTFLTDVKDVTQPPGATVTKVDATTNDSPGATKEFEPGLIENKHPKFTIEFTAAKYSAMLTILKARNSTRLWRVTNPDGSKHGPFAAFISEVGDTYAIEGHKVFDLELCQSTAAPVFTTS